MCDYNLPLLIYSRCLSRTKQRPDLRPLALTLDLKIPEKLSPGYIFVTPYDTENPGPYIYDNEGVRLRSDPCPLPLIPQRENHD
jgi:hypothetical protein